LFGRHARAIPFSSREWELMIGSLLGDATLLKTTAGYCFRVHHGPKQQQLVDWKYAELARFVRTVPRTSGNGYYFRTVTHPKLAELRELFYTGKRKIVPIRLLASCLNEFGLAVWIMDDGAAEGKQLRLNTQSFSVEEAEELRCLIRAKFGVEMTINKDKNRSRLRCTAASMKRLVTLVRSHTLPSMLYKLSL
jgi:hypothetical protein